MAEQTDPNVAPVDDRAKLLDVVNSRIDKALADNRRAKVVAISMTVAVFVLGMTIVTVAYWQRNPYFTAGALVLQGFLYWPIREILSLRRDNLMLADASSTVG